MGECPAIWRHVLAYIVMASIVCLSATTFASGEDDDLLVIVTGLRSQKGNVHIALYDEPNRFPESDGMIFKVEVPIVDGTARHKFNDLAPGRYAVAIYHDENDNDEFDQGFFGIPLEDYAFSNNAPVFLEPPSYVDAAFAVPETREMHIRINE